ncbi:MAG TPA: hypothetical protein VKP30_09550 [Polyangiaceae bacterium]|nr:hypothetical protein [Polyangiaceae bacterium]
MQKVWGFLPLALVLGHAARATAYETKVEASSVLQIYSVRSPWGAPILSRQRLTHTLSLEAHRSLEDIRQSKVSWAFHARLRLDGDYGIRDQEREADATGTFVPGLSVWPVDLSYGYLEIKGLFSNNLSTRVGRQILFDELGLWSYDGAMLTFSPGGIFALAGFAGYEQRGGVPLLSTSRYEADGVYRGDRAGMSPNSWPLYLHSTRPAPAYGGTLSLTAFPWLRARFDYRRVTQHDDVVTVPFADADGRVQTISGSRVSSERMGVAVGTDLGDKASIDGAWVYDVYRRITQQHRLAANYRASSKLRLRAGYRYLLPVFDADSIFNWFGAKGSILIESGANLRLTERIDMSLSGGVRWLGIGPHQWLNDAFTPGPETGVDWLARLESTYFTDNESVGVSTAVESGAAGDRISTDLWHRRAFWDRKLESRVLLNAGRWQHPLMAHRGESSFLYVLGVRLLPGGRPELGAEWEHVISERLTHRFRLLATLSTRWP